MDNNGYVTAGTRRVIVDAQSSVKIISCRQHNQGKYANVDNERVCVALFVSLLALSSCGVIERLFFDAVIVGAGFAAEAAHVVERLIAVPAGAFRFQIRDISRRYASSRLRFSTLVNMVCITHDSAAQKVPSHACLLLDCRHTVAFMGSTVNRHPCPRNIRRSIVSSPPPLKSMAKNFSACQWLAKDIKNAR